MRRNEICCICRLPIKPEHETAEMADTSRTHKICFDVICAGLAADIAVAAEVPPGQTVNVGGVKFVTS